MNCILHRTVILAYLLLVLMSAASVADSLSPDPPQSRPSLQEQQKAQSTAQASLRALSNTQLMQEYDDPGHLLSLAPYAVLSRLNPFPFGDQDIYAFKYRLFNDIKSEIIRRGAPMVTPLADFFEALPKERRPAPTPPLSGAGFWYDTETINLLAKIRDSRSALELVNILIGDTGKTKNGLGEMAEFALESLTYCCFYKSGYNFTPSGGLAVPRLEANGVFPDHSTDSDFQAVADFYRQWLAGEGKDSSQWLPLARHRARLLLATDDPVLINDAALFLTHLDYQNAATMPNDDAPDTTMRRLGEIAAYLEQDGSEVTYDKFTRPKYLYKGHPVPAEVGDLSRFLYHYGRRAQPYAAMLINLVRQGDDGPVYAYEDFGQIGGKDVMAFFAECLPKLDAAVQGQGLAQNPYLSQPLDLDKLPREPKTQALIFAYRACYFGFDREAGRTFADTQARLDWWAANKNKTEEQWLRENLPITADAADKGDAIAQAVLQFDVPDMPRDPYAPFWMATAQVTTDANAVLPPQKPILRALWLKNNANRLRYDPDQDCLRLH